MHNANTFQNDESELIGVTTFQGYPINADIYALECNTSTSTSFKKRSYLKLLASILMLMFVEQIKLEHY